jgi:phage shock protein PspC (stress-responsive transcriptional regulator)
VIPEATAEGSGIDPIADDAAHDQSAAMHPPTSEYDAIGRDARETDASETDAVGHDEAEVHDPLAPSGPGRDGTARLRRSTSRRMLAGVAGGIADRFDIDVSLVRVAFVVLACAWGLGLIVYLAMWALVPKAPDDGTARTVRGEGVDEAPSSWLAFLLLGAVLVFGILVASSWWGGPRWGGGISFLWLVLLAGLLVIACRDRTSRRSLGRFFAIVALGIVTLAIVISGSFFGLVASTGVPLTGGIGDRVYQPTSFSQVRPTYRLAIGQLTVDLRDVRFPRSEVHVTVSVAVGQVIVDVPPGVVVDLSAHAGVGNVTSNPPNLQSFAVPTVSTAADGTARPQLILDVEAGVGQVHLVRAPA